MINNLTIVGCGTIGSCLAIKLAENRDVTHLKIYDYDYVTSESHPFTKSEIGLLKVQMVKFICNKINPYMNVDVYSNKITKPIDNTSFVIDCRDQKHSDIGSIVDVSLDGFRMYIDGRRKRNKERTFHQYQHFRNVDFINRSIDLLISYLHEGNYKYEDLRFINVNTGTQWII